MLDVLLALPVACWALSMQSLCIYHGACSTLMLEGFNMDRTTGADGFLLKQNHCCCAAGWSVNASSLSTLILSNNHLLSGNISTLKLPTSLQALYIANTNMTGRFNETWMGMQSSNFSCLVAHGTPNLCGPLPGSLPCSLVQHTQGTQLGKCYSHQLNYTLHAISFPDSVTTPTVCII